MLAQSSRVVLALIRTCVWRRWFGRSIDVTEPSVDTFLLWRGFDIPAPHLNSSHQERFSSYLFILNCFWILFAPSFFSFLFSLKQLWRLISLESRRLRRNLSLYSFDLVSGQSMECSFQERGLPSIIRRWARSKSPSQSLKPCCGYW